MLLVKMAKEIKSYKRKNNIKLVQNNGFDINETASFLQEFYAKNTSK